MLTAGFVARHFLTGGRAMDPVELYHKLGVKPFQPMRVHLADGRSYDILDRQLVIVGETYLTIGIPAPRATEPIYEHIVRVDVKEIRSLEPLPMSMALGSK
jgi:hypothetical protein